jgi:magnesium-transporting ATPase (P-type)
MEGFYVISCAFKLATDPQMSNISTLARDGIESDLEFAGFLLFENPIKMQAFPTFDTLSNTNISSIIITGDSALTAIHVSRQLKLVRGVVLIDSDATGLFTQRIADVVDQTEWIEPKRLPISHGLEPYLHDGQTQFALTGQALSLLYNSPMLDAILEQTIIFSRAKPDQKTFIVEWLIKQGKYVGMCGGMFGLNYLYRRRWYK